MTTATVRISLIAFACTALLQAAELTDQQKEKFLRTAEVVSAKALSVGITLSHRLTLTDGKLTHDAHFQNVDEYKPVFQGASGSEVGFRDSYRYNIVAYRLDRLLGLNMVPVSVDRKYKGDHGAFTWWVDNVQMMELDRWKKKIEPPDHDAWNDQMYQARLFNELVYNTDPNLGNILIDKSWKIWLIDFTRGFRIYEKLREPNNLVGIRVDRRIWTNLQKLDDATLQKTMGDYLFKNERKALLARRDLIVAFVQQRIAGEGEAAVIRDAPQP